MRYLKRAARWLPALGIALLVLLIPGPALVMFGLVWWLGR